MADLIVKGNIVLTQNHRGVLENGAVAVQGSKIIAVGPAADIERDHGNGAKVLSAGRGLVMPGLINAHTHVSMTCFRGLADDLPLMAWLTENIFPAEAKLTGDVVYWGALLGCAEMIMSGVTTFCDMYLFEHMVARAVNKAGMRGLLGEVLYDFPSSNYGPPEAGLRFTEALIEEYRDHPLIDIAVEPHSTYTCSPDLLQACHHLAEKQGVPLITHLSENKEEVGTIQERYQTTPVRHLDQLGLLTSNLIADHCVVLDDQEIELLSRRGVKVVTNPESNMKLASGTAPVPEMIKAGVTVALGTDGPASNNNLDLFGEMSALAKLHKVVKMDPTVMDAETVLGLGTVGGATALGLEDRVGRIEPGLEADLIVVDIDQPHLTPLYNPYSHMVYAAGGRDVIHSVVGGNVLMENRKLTTLNLDEIYHEIGRIAEIMTAAVGHRESS